MTLEELQILITAETGGLRKELTAVRKQLDSTNKEVQKSTGAISSAFRTLRSTLVAIGIGKLFVDAEKSAMSFEAAMGQINRMMGSSASSFQQWADTTAKSFGLAEDQAIRYGATYANLISGFSSSTAEVTKRTEDLLQASAVVASATGRTLDDVMERIRSGLLGETDAIEDLGINVNQSMIQTTRAFKQIANGRSWQQLNFQSQQAILYYAILEQASRKYGDTLANNTMTRQSQFIAQLRDARLALGQAFLPIYNAVLPALTQMAAAIANVMRFIAAFVQALFGSGGTSAAQQQTNVISAQSSAVSGLGDAYEKAGKKAKGSVANFDKVNLVGGKDSGAGSGAAGSGIPDMGLSNGALNGVSSAMSNVSQKAQEMAAKVKQAFGSMKDFIVQNKAIILASLAGLGAGFASFLVISKWSEIVAGITAGASRIGTAIRSVGIMLTVLLSPAVLIAAAIAALVAAFVYFYETNEKFRGVVDGILKQIGDTAQWLWQNVMLPFGNWLGDAMVQAWNAMGTAAQWAWKNVLAPFGAFLQTLWKTVIAPLASVVGEALAIAFKTVAAIAKDFWQLVLVPLGKALSEMFGPAVEAVTAVLTFLWKNAFVPFGSFVKSTILPILQALADAVVWLWKNAMQPLAIFVAGILVDKFKTAFSIIGTIINGAKETFVGLMNFITGVFTGNWSKAWEGVKTVFKGVFDSLWGIVKLPLNQIIDGINAMINGLNKVKVDVPGWVEKVTGYSSFGFSIPTIPRLAKGGLAFGPTLAMVGDNRGASSDPEVIAPLSKLAEFMPNGDNSEMLAVLRQIRDAIGKGSSVSVSITRDQIGQAASQYIVEQTRRGKNPIAPAF